jgi:hypothetical protein
MSEREPLDDLADRLFAAARRERPSDAVREGALNATRTGKVESASDESERAAAPAANVVSRRRSRRPIYVALALAAAALTGVLLDRARREPPVAIGPEAPSARWRAEATPPVPATPELSLSAESIPEQAPKRALPRLTPHESVPQKLLPRATAEPSPVESAAPPRAPATLSEEVAALDRARSALGGGDASTALRALDDYDHVLHGTRLSEEATLLRVEALSRSGQAAAASRLAQAFIRANPGSPLAERARGFAGSGDSLATRVDAGGLK